MDSNFIGDLEESRSVSGIFSDNEIIRTASGQYSLQAIVAHFPLPWSDYVLLLAVQNPEARAFYEAEALRGVWSVRQLAREIDSQFYERTALFRNKAAMLKKGAEGVLAGIQLGGDAKTEGNPRPR